MSPEDREVLWELSQQDMQNEIKQLNTTITRLNTANEKFTSLCMASSDPDIQMGAQKIILQLCSTLSTI